jgi:pimeloyl-ACP methyl ester carboxylesterase
MGGLYVRERGDGALLLLHAGLGQGSWVWRWVLPTLAERFRTIVFDTRGTGRSPSSHAPYGIEDLATDAADVLSGRRAHVLGFSMGGYVALTLALREPELVRSLVLAGTGAGGPERVPRAPEVRAAFAAALGRPPAEYGRLTTPYTLAPGWPAANAERYEEILAARLERPTPYETIEAHAAACYGFYDAGCTVELIDVPALVLHGECDRIVPVENGRRLAERLPRAEYVELPGRGHNLMLEDPDAFTGLACGFLERVD